MRGIENSELEINFFSSYQPKNSSNSDDEGNNSDGDLDDLECNLLGENRKISARSLTSKNADFGKNANFSARVQNDITRSEKKSEKRISFQGRDDRATSEQVMDPRTRLMLFKMLSSGYLSVIDGKILILIQLSNFVS